MRLNYREREGERGMEGGRVTRQLFYRSQGGGGGEAK